jgi:predicted RNA polymerase sigma factor
VKRTPARQSKWAHLFNGVLPCSAANDPDGLKTEEDDRLWMLFACCHPLIPQETQIILALTTLFGFSRAEIARAFLTTEKTIAKRLTQARQNIREARIRFEIPAGAELSRCLSGVLQTLYLLFNEGYNASCGGRLIREEL